MKHPQKLSSRPDWETIQWVHENIRPFIHRTPVLSCSALNEMSGAELYFKCENFQKVGAFKMRGASAAALFLTEEEKARGIATHSSGNHAQAVALTGKLNGIPAYIVMPENAPAIKRKATEGYGAKVIPCAPTLQAREDTLEQVVAETGATFIHPYNDYHVIAGQASCAKELLEDQPDLDIVMAPIGGGGLMSGTALSSRQLRPQARVIGAEPQIVDDAFRSFQAGKIVTNTRIDTIADGLRTNLGEKTFAIIQEEVDDILTVSEEMIVQAMRLIWERMKIIIEPSCAVPFAAVLSHPAHFQGKKTGIILTGGNVDLEKLPWNGEGM
jgi:threonine dehydratase